MKFENSFYWVLNDNNQVIHCPLREYWSKWMNENREACIVGQDVIGYAHISTVFVGVNLSLRHERLLTFETLVQEPSGKEIRKYCWSTWNEAEEKHKHLVRFWKNALADDKFHY